MSQFQSDLKAVFNESQSGMTESLEEGFKRFLPIFIGNEGQLVHEDNCKASIENAFDLIWNQYAAGINVAEICDIQKYREEHLKLGIKNTLVRLRGNT